LWVKAGPRASLCMTGNRCASSLPRVCAAIRSGTGPRHIGRHSFHSSVVEFWDEAIGATAFTCAIKISCFVVAQHLNRFLRTLGASESAYTFCEPADEVLRAHHNGDTPDAIEKKLIGRHQPECLMATAESRCHHHYLLCLPSRATICSSRLIKGQWRLSANAVSSLVKRAT
jgi:hypothetical protein